MSQHNVEEETLNSESQEPSSNSEFLPTGCVTLDDSPNLSELSFSICNVGIAAKLLPVEDCVCDLILSFPSFKHLSMERAGGVSSHTAPLVCFGSQVGGVSGCQYVLRAICGS